MSLKKKPIRAKLHSAPTAMSLSDKKALNEGSDFKRNKIEEEQEAIDIYNFDHILEKDEHFDEISLVDNSVIVRLHKENYIKEVSLMPTGDVIYDAFYSQVDGRMNRTQKENWVDNPLPYVFSGVIVAISPITAADFKKKEEEIPGYVAPKVGDIVSLSHFMIADMRYYPNKQARDFIKNPEEYRIVHFEGYVKLHSSMIESVVTNVDGYMMQMSPYNNLKKYLKDKENEK